MTLPHGYRVSVAEGVIVANHGRTLVGGSPLTSITMSRRATSYLSGRTLVVTDSDSAQVAQRLLATNLAVPDVSHLHPADAAEVTVVIPVRDRPHQLDHALTALPGLHCLVVDDASTDPDMIVEVARRHGASYHRLDHNLGPAGARNAGLRLVTTPYVAFVDSDVHVTPSVLLDLTRHFADPGVALVAPKVVGVSTSLKPRWFERYDEHASSLTLGDAPATVRPGAAVAWLPSACVVARRQALGDGFTDDMRVGEDVDLVWRLVAAGHRVRYDPSLVAEHDTRGTVRSWLGRKAFYGTGSALLGARHGDAVAPAVLSPWYAAAAAALLLRRTALVPVAVVALAHGHRSVARALPDMPEKNAVAARIAARGMWWAVRQESALLLRHWWPLTAVGAASSKGVRRVLATCLVVDTGLLLTDCVGQQRFPRPADLLARRLDDVAYGAGLSWGSLRTFSITALRVRWVGRWPASTGAARPGVRVRSG